MPRDNNTRICNQTELECVVKAEELFLSKKVYVSLKFRSKSSNRGRTVCNCLPSCTSITYDTEISQARFEFEKVFTAMGFDSSLFTDTIFSKMTIYFKDEEFVTSQRSELYGVFDFVANCGGLLGERTNNYFVN